jgi:uncharacterized protein (TIGR03118 family)
MVGCGVDSPERFQAAVKKPPNSFEVELLVSNQFGVALLVDSFLVNPWGLATGPGGPWWVADNGTDMSTLYTSLPAKASLEVSVPGAPTGLVFNSSGDNTAFIVSAGGTSGAAIFIFATEGGTLLGWNPGVPPPPPPPPSRTAQLAFTSTNGAIYKGLAIAGTRLYATDFHNAHVDIFDRFFHLVTIAGAFVDPDIPEGFAPFGIRAIGSTIYVTYAKQDAAAEDDVAGAGLGFVNAFDLDGNFQFRVASGQPLNAPWGLAMAPAAWGPFGGMLLVGNFGNGRIHAFDLSDCKDSGCANAGALHDQNGGPIRIDGLWAIDFGKGANSGNPDQLFFTAGPNDEADGLFGLIQPAE